MALILSKGQKQAIDTKNKNILVSAAAGSGKTFVLTQRVLTRIIEDRWNIDSFLIVTFTRDAAGEMRARIVKSIEKKLAEIVNENTDNSLIEHLQKQLVLINKANISTIDAFCSSVVRQNFHKTDLDSGYKSPSGVEALDLRKQALNDAIEELLAVKDNDFMSFYNGYTGKTNDNIVVNMILSLYTFADSMPYPEKWLDNCVSKYNVDSFFESVWGKVYIYNIKSNIEKAKIYANEAMVFFKYCNKNDIPAVMEKVFLLIDDFENAFKIGGIDEVSKLEVKFTISLRSVKEEYALEHIDVIKRYLNFVKDSLNSALKSALIPREMTEFLFNQTKSDVKALVDVTKLFMSKYLELKMENQLAEFNDISHICLNMLRDESGNTTKIAEEYQKKYNEIIIDEYQDSNHLQEEILTAVSKVDKGNNNIFMVGDIKQAIYRFRQTTPELFIEKYNKYTQGNEKEELILLSENYRSRNVVLDACNLVFKQIMDKRLGDVDYTEEVYLNPKAEFPVPDENINISNSTELLMVDTANVKEGIAESDIDEGRAEAKIIAKRIYEMLYTNPLYIYDKDEEKYRALEKKDIVILVNRRTNAGVIFEELNAVGLSCMFEVANSLFKVTEVKDIISVLKLINNPLQDIEIVNTLHSPMYGLSFDEITKIRVNERKSNIYTAVKLWAENTDETAQVLKKFIEDIEYYRDYAINNSIVDLINEIYSKSNYFNYVGIQDNGSFKQGNLRLFKEKAVEFEAYGPMDLHSFIEYIDTDLSDEVEDKNKVSVASNLGENEDVIKIMTIHKSKGLEFPVVFVSQMQNKISNKYKSNDYIFDRELGIGLKFIDQEMRMKYKTMPYNIIVDKYEEEEKSENLRLLYVALTRAREKLIITGVTNSRGGKTGKGAILNDLVGDKNTVLPYPLRNAADSPLFWILSALKRKNFDTSKVIEESWVCLENVTGLEEYQVNNAIGVIDKIEAFENAQVKNEYKNLIEERLNFKYPYTDRTLLPSKISITEIKRKMNSQNEESKEFFKTKAISGTAKFLKEEEKVTAAQLGTLYHTVMEHIDFRNTESKADVSKLLEYLRDRGIITNGEKEILSEEKIFDFVKSDLFKRIKCAEGIYTEAPFVMSIKASRLKEYENSDADLVVHGIIDLYFEEDGKLIIVDYKTDKVFKNMYELVNKYKIQLELYKEALQKNTGRKVDECIIYSIDKGEAINV